MVRGQFCAAVLCITLSVACEIHAGTPAGTSFTYQGRLNSNGTPAEGSHDFSFKLFDADSGGSQVGSTICADNISVAGGLFTVSLDFGAAFTTSARWLEISVRADNKAGNCGSGNYTKLSPRQRVTPAPVSMFALSTPTPHALDAADGSPVNAMWCDNSGLVGLGTTEPRFSLEVATRSVYGKPALGVADGDTYAYLHVNAAADHSLIWDGGHALRFGTETALGEGYAEHMRIDSLGRVGIGTSSPLTTLHVAGAMVLTEFGSSIPTIQFTTLGGSKAYMSDQSGNTTVEFDGELGRLDLVGPSSGILVQPTDGYGSAVMYVYHGTGYLAADVVGGTRINGYDGVFSNTLGINTESNGWTLACNGEAGKPGGGSWSAFCDERLKHDATPMSGTLDRLLSLHGYEFEYSSESVEKGWGLPGRQLGLMAQEVEQVFPDWVGCNDDGYLFVTERATTALMVEALRDLRAEKDREIEALQCEVEHLRAQLAASRQVEDRLAAVERALSERVTD